MADLLEASTMDIEHEVALWALISKDSKGMQSAEDLMLPAFASLQRMACTSDIKYYSCHEMRSHIEICEVCAMLLLSCLLPDDEKNKLSLSECDCQQHI